MASARNASEARVEREANYAAVGAFVLLVIVMGGLFVYWYSDSRDNQDYSRFEIYFEGSVAGLERGAPVRYLGVDVGRVVRMIIDPRASNRVQVIVDIASTTPVSERTVAQLSLQGITGLLYIDLVENPERAKELPAVPSQRYAVIPSTPSPFDLVLNSLPQTLAKAGEALARINDILSEDNARALEQTVGDIAEASAYLPATMSNIEGLLVELRGTVKEINTTAMAVRNLTDTAAPNVATALESAREVTERLADTAGRVDRLIADNERELRSFARDALPELERLLRESREASAQVRDLARSLKEQPSQLLYEQSYYGVEIPQ